MLFRQITVKYIQTAICKFYFKIQSETLFIQFITHSLWKFATLGTLLFIGRNVQNNKQSSNINMKKQMCTVGCWFCSNVESTIMKIRR